MERKAKYRYMLKEQKRKIRQDFKSTKCGKSRISLLNRLFVEGLLCLVIGVVVLIYAIIDSMRWSYFSLAILLLIGGIVFVITQVVVRYMEYDKYIVDNSKKKKRK